MPDKIDDWTRMIWPELKTRHKDSMESIEVAKIMDDLDGLLYDSGLDAVSKDTGIEKKIISITKLLSNETTIT